MVIADLHTHSTASDGALCASRMLELGSDAGLLAMAVTDHDTLDGARNALSAASETGMAIVPGVELSTLTDGRDVHMLGYFLDPQNPALNSFFENSRNCRRDRALAIAAKLAAAGFPIDVEELREGNEVVNRTLLARKLVSSGDAASVDDAFDRLIGKTSPYYVETEYPDTARAVQLIRDAGGYAFIAHPAHYHVVDLIAGLVDCGLNGLEAYHSLQTPAQSNELVDLAAKLGLAVSGGSDWHGDATHGAHVGGAGLDAAGLEAFLAACGSQGEALAQDMGL